MKKIILSLISLASTMSINAQIIEVYKNGGEEPIAVYRNKATERYKLAFQNHPEVDLGLPSGTLWGTCNVGASLPELSGNYYAWGEPIPQNPQKSNSYTWASYKYANGESDKLTKYCSTSSYGDNGYTDDKTVLDAKDDAATANMGAKWCIPTEEQWKELKENCLWTWTTDYNNTGVVGYIVSSKKEGNTNSIFLPVVGFYSKGRLQFENSICNYWSSSLYTSYPNCAWMMSLTSSSYNVSPLSDRCPGYQVRAVRKKNKK